MSAINEQTKWEDEVYLLAREDRVEGGIYGPSNKQARQLANRTRYLKTAVESLQDYRDYTFFMTADDPDGTVAGLAGTPEGKLFRVVVPDSEGQLLAFIYYQKHNGQANRLNALASQQAITSLRQQLEQDTGAALDGLTALQSGLQSLTAALMQLGLDEMAAQVTSMAASQKSQSDQIQALMLAFQSGMRALALVEATRPVFTILKEMQASFEKNKLGTGQRAEYMKTIFGEEASSAAAVLMNAAQSGKLDQLTAAFKASDGKTEELVKVMQDNLGGDFKEFQSAYEAVGTDLFDQQESSLRKLVQTATGYVLKLDNWIQRNKALAQTLGVITAVAIGVVGMIGTIGLIAWPVITGVNAIIAAATALGAVFTTVAGGIITAIGAISWPVVAVVAAIVAGALLIRKYWEPVSAFFGGVIDGLRAAFAPIADLFAPLKPMFDWLGGKLKAAWDWFNNLITPVKSSQETLNRFRDAGVLFGQRLADALTLPLTAFNKLRSGIDWVLEKLGVINKESSTLDQTAAKANAATQGGSYIPATSTYGGYQAYQPVTAPAGRTYIDQSSPTYQINMPGNAPGGQLGNQLQDALEKYERDKRARARASMMHD